MNQVLSFLNSLSGPVPYFGIFGILLLCGFGLPIPEDITLFAAGMLSYYGKTDITLSVAIAFLGVMIGDCTMYFLGHHFGSRLTKKWIFHKLLPDERLEKVRLKLHEHGYKLMFMARFMPGLRSPVFFSAGTLHLPFRVFIFYDGLAAMISVPTIVLAVYFAGRQVEKVIETIKNVEHGIGVAVFLIVAIALIKWYLSHRKNQKNSATG